MTLGLGARRVKAVAAAKHHTVVTTEGGEVFTWGSNRGKQYPMAEFVLMLASAVMHLVNYTCSHAFLLQMEGK